MCRRLKGILSLKSSGRLLYEKEVEVQFVERGIFVLTGEGNTLPYLWRNYDPRMMHNEYSLKHEKVDGYTFVIERASNSLLSDYLAHVCAKVNCDPHDPHSEMYVEGRFVKNGPVRQKNNSGNNPV